VKLMKYKISSLDKCERQAVLFKLKDGKALFVAIKPGHRAKDVSIIFGDGSVLRIA